MKIKILKTTMSSAMCVLLLWGCVSESELIQRAQNEFLIDKQLILNRVRIYKVGETEYQQAKADLADLEASDRRFIKTLLSEEETIKYNGSLLEYVSAGITISIERTFPDQIINVCKLFFFKSTPQDIILKEGKVDLKRMASNSKLTTIQCWP